MKTFKLDYVYDIMEGCVNNDYKSICKAGRLISDLASGIKDIEAKPEMKACIKTSLYRKFMRAYTRYIMNNPNIIKDIAMDCSFTSMSNGEFIGIEEP